MAVQTLIELFSLQCDLQSGREVLWSRKMNSVAVLDNVPVLPAHSLRQYVHIKIKILSLCWWLAHVLHNTFVVKLLARQTCIHRCEMLHNTVFFLHLTCWWAWGNEESVEQKVSGSLWTGPPPKLERVSEIWLYWSERWWVITSGGVSTCRNDQLRKSALSESRLSHTEPSVTQSDDQPSCFYVGWARRRSVSGVSGERY